MSFKSWGAVAISVGYLFLVPIAGALPPAAVMEVQGQDKSVTVEQKAADADSINITLHIGAPEQKQVVARSGDPFSQIELKGFGNDNTVGAPALPIITHTIEVPWDSQVSAEITGRNYTQMGVTGKLYPQQPPLPKVDSANQPKPAQVPPTLVIDEESYSGSRSKGFQKAAGGDQVQVQVYKKRGRQYALLTVRPFEYDATQALVRYPKELDLQVRCAVGLPKAAGPRLGEISVVQITIGERSELDKLTAKGYDVSNVKGQTVTIYASVSELAALKAAGYTPVLIEKQTPGVPKTTATGNKGLGTYHTYDTMTSDLQTWAAANPGICRLSSIGQSVQGRELWVVKITDNPDTDENEPEFKYIGNIHGDEPVSLEMCMYFVNHLLTNYGTDSRVTQLVDSTEIWILPSMNPDGLTADTRANASGIDLNRSFPDGASETYNNISTGPYNNTAGRPVEVAAVMAWSQSHHFVASANFHGGSLVVNYPFDNANNGNVDSPTPDDLLFEDIALRYSINNSPMYASTTFTNGITNGAAWYVVEGGMQDWNYRYLGCNEVTVELGDDKQPAESTLPTLWGNNRESMLAYLEAVHIGVRGVVTDVTTGQPVAAVVRVQDNTQPVFADSATGTYQRMLLPGTYTLTVSAPGYKRQSFSATVTSAGPVTQNIALQSAEGNMIVVANSALPADNFVAEKQAEGFDVHLITVSDSPTAETVRDQIRTVYNSYLCDTVVLVGDVDKVPTFNDGSSYSDLLYALMDSGETWTDYLGKDMVVGRISVDTTAELADYVSKLAAMWTASKHNDLTWIAGGNATWENDVVEQTHTWVKQYCVSEEITNTNFYRDSGTANEFNAHLNAGTDAVIYSGHGANSYWARWSYGATNMAGLTNTLDAPIIIGHCCVTGSLNDDACLAELWLQTSARALAYVGASNNSYWVEDDVMEKSEFLAMQQNPKLNLAQAVQFGLERVQDMSPSNARYYFTIYHVFGDPTVKIFAAPGPGPGKLTLDRTAYNCSATVQIGLRDFDQSGAGSLTVAVTSTTETTAETVTLNETPSGSGHFTGSLPIVTGTPATDDVLQIAAGDSIEVSYNDPNDGNGQPVVIQTTASVDCAAPGISNVVSSVNLLTATVTFTTDEGACGRVDFGTDCGTLNQTISGSCGLTSHQISLSNLQSSTTYFFQVAATDSAGNQASDNNGGSCYTFTTPAVPDDYFTQQFSTGTNDLANQQVTFTPNGSINFYAACVSQISSLPTDPSGATAVTLGDDGSVQVTLTGATVQLYGQSYNTFFIGSNGYITFGSGDTAYTESTSAHFSLPRIAAMFNDLNPSSSGTVSWIQTADRVAVSWVAVPKYGTAGTNTFQIEMFFDGRIAVSYLTLSATDGLAGLSQGLGVPTNFVQSDLSGYGACGPCPPSAANSTVTLAFGAGASNIALQASDPNGDSLSYTILTLPTHGRLADPAGEVISSVPYTLLNAGVAVRYTPRFGFGGADSFTFKVNDGNAPPDGGDSNTATVSIDVLGVVYAANMDSDPGWTLGSGWAYGTPTGGGSYNPGNDPTSGHTGTNVIGYNLAGDYGSSLTSVLWATTPAVNCSVDTNIVLRFWRWLGVENALYDHASIQVSADGTNWTTLWEHAGATVTDATWTLCEYTVPSAIGDHAATLYFRWGMGTTDASEVYCGWNIDDVEVLGMRRFAVADFDLDGDVDEIDLAHFDACTTAPHEIQSLSSCQNADIDGDGDVDQSDFGIVQRCLSGSSLADPDCGD